MTALIGGFVLGMARLVAELNKEVLSGWLFWFANLNFLYFAAFLFLICIAILIVVSVLTSKSSYEKIQGLAYATAVSADRVQSSVSWNYKDLPNSLLIIAILALVLLYFSPVFMK